MLTAFALSSALLLAQVGDAVTRAELDRILEDARERRQCVYSHALLFAQFSTETAGVVAKRAVEKCGPTLTKEMSAGEALHMMQNLEKELRARVFDWRVKAAMMGSHAYDEIAKQLDVKPITEFSVPD